MLASLCEDAVSLMPEAFAQAASPSWVGRRRAPGRGRGQCLKERAAEGLTVACSNDIFSDPTVNQLLSEGVVWLVLAL